jgi:hypothetical protein
MSLSIENMDNRPWYPHHIPSCLRAELYRRSIDVGIYNSDINPTYSWNDDTGKSYRGPLIPWHRVCSNGTGIKKRGSTQTPRNGFVWSNLAGADNTYGLNNNGVNVLGTDVDGKPHILTDVSTLRGGGFNEAPLYMPSPNITLIEATIQKERIRRVVLNWKCHGFAQLQYLTPYFLTPGISVVVEFGWNHYNQYEPLVDYKDIKQLKRLYADGTPLYQKILKSNGMYDVTFGTIANFEFSSPDGIIYECKTEIWSKHRNHTGVFINDSTRMNKIGTTVANTKVKTKPSLYEFFNQRLKKVNRCLDGNGFNFFDPLDDGEESRITDADTELASTFNDGKKENRIFVGRGRTKNDPLTDVKLETDWDNGDSDKTWITMGFLVELLNLFIAQEIDVEVDKKPLSIYHIDIDDCIIGGHPNLISTDGNVILIPNANAPKFNLGMMYWTEDYRDKTSGAIDFRDAGDKNKFQHQFYPTPVEKISPSMTPENRQLFQVFRTGYADYQGGDTYIGGGAYRDDLDVIINRFQYEFGDRRYQRGERSFPQYKVHSGKGGRKDGGYWGYLKDIYVNVDLIINLAKSSSTSKNFYDSLFKKMTDAAAGMWDLEIVESDESLKIIDKKFIDPVNLRENLYQFDISSTSILRGITFSSNMSNAQANQVIAGSSNNRESQGIATSTELPDFLFADRLGINQIVPEKMKTLVNDNSAVIKKLQKYGKVENSFLMSMSTGGYKAINLCLPSNSLLLSILNDGDDSRNTNIYGGQQPNFTCELVLCGISGLRTFQCFSIRNLPEPYSPNEVIFQIVDVSHTVSDGDWKTIIKASIRPIKGSRNFSNGKEEYDSITLRETKNLQ